MGKGRKAKLFANTLSWDQIRNNKPNKKDKIDETMPSQDKTVISSDKITYKSIIGIKIDKMGYIVDPEMEEFLHLMYAKEEKVKNELLNFLHDLLHSSKDPGIIDNIKRDIECLKKTLIVDLSTKQIETALGIARELGYDESYLTEKTKDLYPFTTDDMNRLITISDKYQNIEIEI